tara:strand:- start:399 stop:1499 length:1101 start_codon:yes stop_codon:yes gene_type:complete
MFHFVKTGGLMADIHVAFVRVSDLFKHLRDFGFAREKLLSKAGISDSALKRYESLGRVPANVFSRLYFSAAALIPEPLRERYWAGGLSGRAFHLTAYAMVTARSLQQALERAHDLHQMFDEQRPRVSVSSDTGLVRFTYLPARMPSREDMELIGKIDAERILSVASAAGLVQWFSFLSWMIGQRIKLERVVLRETPGLIVDNRNVERLLEFVNIEYLPGNSFIEFSVRYMEADVVITAESLDRYLNYSPIEPMPTLLTSGTIADHIRGLIGTDFSNGFPGFSQLANRVGLTPSTLRRRLMAENTSYQMIKDDARKTLALALLRNTQMPIGEIAERAGFMSHGSFSRAFHFWMGEAPGHYRSRYRMG